MLLDISNIRTLKAKAQILYAQYVPFSVNSP
jgi:hypothetical protein